MKFEDIEEETKNTWRFNIKKPIIVFCFIFVIIWIISFLALYKKNGWDTLWGNDTAFDIFTYITSVVALVGIGMYILTPSWSKQVSSLIEQIPFKVKSILDSGSTRYFNPEYYMLANGIYVRTTNKAINSDNYGLPIVDKNIPLNSFNFNIYKKYYKMELSALETLKKTSIEAYGKINLYSQMNEWEAKIKAFYNIMNEFTRVKIIGECCMIVKSWNRGHLLLHKSNYGEFVKDLIERSEWNSSIKSSINEYKLDSSKTQALRWLINMTLDDTDGNNLIMTSDIIPNKSIYISVFKEVWALLNIPISDTQPQNFTFDILTALIEFLVDKKNVLGYTYIDMAWFKFHALESFIQKRIDITNTIKNYCLTNTDPKMDELFKIITEKLVLFPQVANAIDSDETITPDLSRIKNVINQYKNAINQYKNAINQYKKPTMKEEDSKNMLLNKFTSNMQNKQGHVILQTDNPNMVIIKKLLPYIKNKTLKKYVLSQNKNIIKENLKLHKTIQKKFKQFKENHPRLLDAISNLNRSNRIHPINSSKDLTSSHSNQHKNKLNDLITQTFSYFNNRIKSIEEQINTNKKKIYASKLKLQIQLFSNEKQEISKNIISEAKDTIKNNKNELGKLKERQQLTIATVYSGSEEDISAVLKNIRDDEPTDNSNLVIDSRIQSNGVLSTPKITLEIIPDNDNNLNSTTLQNSAEDIVEKVIDAYAEDQVNIDLIKNVSEEAYNNAINMGTQQAALIIKSAKLIEAVVKANKDLMDKKSELNKLEEKLLEETNKFTNLIAEKTKVAKEIEEMTEKQKADRTQIEKDKKFLNEKTKTLASQEQALTERLISVDKYAQEIQNEKEKLESQYNELTASYTTEKVSTTKQLNEKIHQIKTLEAERDKINSKNDDITRKLTDLQKQNNDITQNQIIMTHKQEEQIKELNSQNIKLTVSYNDSMIEFKKQQLEIDSELNLLQKEKQKLEDHLKKNEMLVEDLTTKLDNYKSTLLEKELAMKKDAENLTKEKEDLEAKIEKHNLDINELNKKNTELDEENKILKEKLEEFKKNATNTQSVLIQTMAKNGVKHSEETKSLVEQLQQNKEENERLKATLKQKEEAILKQEEDAKNLRVQQKKAAEAKREQEANEAKIKQKAYEETLGAARPKVDSNNHAHRNISVMPARNNLTELPKSRNSVGVRFIGLDQTPVQTPDKVSSAELDELLESTY